MKKLLLILILCLIFLPKSTFANGAGLPPFFEVNGKLSIPNPLQVYGITASTFLIPQDFTAENYLINQQINFKVDQDKLGTVIPLSLIKNVRYDWDYGDGTKATGLQNTHSYAKMGSYILVLTINIYPDLTQPPTQFVDSFLLNILPDKNYANLPQSILQINGQMPKDAETKEIDLDFNNSINFDASISQTPGGTVSQYLWNFGDGQTSSQQITTHKYTDPNFKVVVLRVKDSNGFMSDNFVGLKNTPQKSVSLPVQTSNSSTIIMALLGLLFIICGITYFKLKKLPSPAKN